MFPLKTSLIVYIPLCALCSVFCTIVCDMWISGLVCPTQNLHSMLVGLMQSQTGLIKRAQLQWIGLPAWQPPFLPFPTKPSLQLQLYDPTLFTQVALTSQSWDPAMHSSMSSTVQIKQQTTFYKENLFLNCFFLAVSLPFHSTTNYTAGWQLSAVLQCGILDKKWYYEKKKKKKKWQG